MYSLKKRQTGKFSPHSTTNVVSGELSKIKLLKPEIKNAIAENVRKDQEREKRDIFWGREGYSLKQVIGYLNYMDSRRHIHVEGYRKLYLDCL